MGKIVMHDFIVVSDSCPLISLCSIKKLDILKLLFGKIYISEAVFSEVVIMGDNRYGQKEVSSAKWIKRQKIDHDIIERVMPDKLDLGERESIALANTFRADYIILDEKLARQKASQIGLNVIGTLGILLMAKKSGYIQNISILLDKLEKASFRMSRQVKLKILEQAGE